MRGIQESSVEKPRNLYEFFFRLDERFLVDGFRGVHGRAKAYDAVSRYPLHVRKSEEKTLREDLGLCADCRFRRTITSDRGSHFYQCERSHTDPTFPKYPRLPVLQCKGYGPSSENQMEPETETGL